MFSHPAANINRRMDYTQICVLKRCFCSDDKLYRFDILIEIRGTSASVAELFSRVIAFRFLLAIVFLLLGFYFILFSPLAPVSLDARLAFGLDGSVDKPTDVYGTIPVAETSHPCGIEVVVVCELISVPVIGEENLYCFRKSLHVICFCSMNGIIYYEPRMRGVTALAGGSSHLADELAVIGIAVREVYEQYLPGGVEVYPLCDL